jgi:hypothetical protein
VELYLHFSNTSSWRGASLGTGTTLTSFLCFELVFRKKDYIVLPCNFVLIRGPYEKFVDWRQCAAVMQREAVTVRPSCSGGGNVVVAF